MFDDAITRAIPKMLVFPYKAVVFRKTLETADLTRLKFPFVHCTGPKCKVHYIHVHSYEYIDNDTWAREDMEFLFECSTRYLTSERSERVGYRIEHEKRNSISPSNHVLLCILYKHKSPQHY